MEIRARIEHLLAERKWTRYRLSMPSLSTLEAIASAFGMTLSQFFFEGNDIIELTEEQKDLLTSWSLLTKKQRQIILDLTKSIPDP